MNKTKKFWLIFATAIIALGLIVGSAFISSIIIPMPYSTMATMSLSYLIGTCAGVIIGDIRGKYNE